MGQLLTLPKLYYIITDLPNDRQSPNDDEKRVGENVSENVRFPVNFSRINFIEKSHENKCIENQSEMLRRHFVVLVSATVHVY